MFKVTFTPARDGGVTARVEGRVAFPARRDPRASQVKPGETWEVEIAGENPRQTVYFLRLLRSPEEIKQAEATEAAARKAAEAAAEAAHLAAMEGLWRGEVEPFLVEIASWHLGQEATRRIQAIRPRLGRMSVDGIRSMMDGYRRREAATRAMLSAWENRTPAPPAGEPPAPPPKHNIPTMTAWCSWVEGEYSKYTMEYYSCTCRRELRLIDPDRWEAPARAYFQACADYAGVGAEAAAEASIEEIRRRMKHTPSAEAMAAATKEAPAALDIIPEYVAISESLELTPAKQAADAAYTARYAAWRDAVRQHKLTRLEDEGGLVRIDDNGIPCIPVIDGEEPGIAQLEVIDGRLDVTGELASWHEYEEYLECE